jgi:virginiamycin B lyase
MNRIAIAGLLFACSTAPALTAQRKAVRPKPGVTDVQVPFGSLKPSATIKIGGTADWVLVTDNAVWVASTKPYSVQRIDSGNEYGHREGQTLRRGMFRSRVRFGSVWVPVCSKKPLLARVDALTNRITALLPIAPAGPEGGITASSDSVWIVTDKDGTTLSRINPATNTVRQKISIPAGSYNPLSSGSMVCITGFDKNLLTVVDASSGKVLASIPVGSKPRFLTSGGRFCLDFEPRRWICNPH